MEEEREVGEEEHKGKWRKGEGEKETGRRGGGKREAGEKREIWARSDKGQRSLEKESEGGGRTSSLLTFVSE